MKEATKNGFSYQRIDAMEEIGQPPSSYWKDTWKSKLFAIIGISALILVAMVHSSTLSTEASSPDRRIVMHISDTHIDPLFDATMSMKEGVCHSCELNTKVYGDKSSCPKKFLPDNAHLQSRIRSGYAFGRYGCNPPHLLFESLRMQMRSIDPNPKVIVFTGDISPHGYPDDDYKLDESTTLDDLCNTKFLVTKHLVEDLVLDFPNTRWAYALGNNDHFPKDTYWQPYIDKYGDMLYETGFFTKTQRDQFVNYGGSSYLDSDNVRYIAIDYTLFTAGGEGEAEVSKRDKDNEHALYPLRHKVCKWLRESLQDAAKKGLSVYIVGHQPLTTKKGKDEFDVEDFHYQELKNVFEEYSSIIRVGLFGHRNLAGLSNVVAEDSFTPLFPSITGPGVSPRGKNHPSFNVLYQSVEDGTVLDFEQWKLPLMDENYKAQALISEDATDDDDSDEDSFYLGEWSKHHGILSSWKTLSGEDEFTEDSLATFLARVTDSEELFFAMEVWKRAGYIGDETPEAYACKALYDKEETMMKCLFPNQDIKCWKSGWLQ